MRITTTRICDVSSRLARSVAALVSRNGRFWAVFGCFQESPVFMMSHGA